MENLAGIIVMVKGSRNRISFRSNKKYPHKGLCEKICSHFKGGGHKTAASCNINANVLN